MGEAILVTSGKGGSGKSTFSVNVGAALARRGKSVLLIDADAGLRALDLMLSVTDRIVYDLSDALSGACSPNSAVVKTDFEGLFLLPAPTAADERIFTPDAMKRLCGELSRFYDVLLLDSPAGLGPGMKAAASAAQRAVIVSAADPVSIRDADRVAEECIRQGVSDIRLVINRVVARLIRKKTVGSLDSAIDAAAVRLLGLVPEDEQVTLSVYRGGPVPCSRKSPASIAFDNIARRLTGESVTLLKL